MFSILVGYLTLLLFLVSTAAVDDHYISNGTCYYKAGAIADNSYAPVGNIIYGHTYCCALGGDKINNNNACYDDSTHYTYLAGCTDPTYAHSSCPYKGNYSDHQWVGLVSCPGKGWAGCVNDGSPTLRKTPQSEGCTCDPDGDEILFDRNGGLDAVGFMPDKEGETISYLPGMRPTSFSSYPAELASATATSTRVLTTATVRVSTFSVNNSTIKGSQTGATTPLSSASTPTFTSTVSGMSGGYVSSDGPYTGLSHSAVAGISVGSCAAGVILIIGGFLLWRHRKQKQAVDQSTEKDFERNSASPDDNSAILGFSEADSRTSTYAGTKSELPGSPVTANTSQRDSLASQRSQPQPPSPLSKEQYYYRPFRYQPANGFDNIQELPTQERTAYTQTGSRLSSLENAVTNAGRQHNGNNDIHELPG